MLQHMHLNLNLIWPWEIRCRIHTQYWNELTNLSGYRQHTVLECTHNSSTQPYIHHPEFVQTIQPYIAHLILLEATFECEPIPIPTTTDYWSESMTINIRNKYIFQQYFIIPLVKSKPDWPIKCNYSLHPLHGLLALEASTTKF